MKLRLVMATVISVMLVSACGTNNKSPYMDSLRSFDGELVDHFPKDHSGLLGFYSLAPDQKSMNKNKGKYIAATFEYNKIRGINLEKLKSLSKYVLNDTCQIVISNLFKFIYDSDCVCASKPIPDFIIEIDKYKLLSENFNIDEENIEEVKLPEDFEYFVSAKQGLYIENEFLFKYDKKPFCWEHGFSRGYALSKRRNIVIMWLEIW